MKIEYLGCIPLLSYCTMCNIIIIVFIYIFVKFKVFLSSNYLTSSDELCRRRFSAQLSFVLDVLSITDSASATQYNVIVTGSTTRSSKASRHSYETQLSYSFFNCAKCVSVVWLRRDVLCYVLKFTFACGMYLCELHRYICCSRTLPTNICHHSCSLLRRSLWPLLFKGFHLDSNRMGNDTYLYFGLNSLATMFTVVTEVLTAIATKATRLLT